MDPSDRDLRQISIGIDALTAQLRTLRQQRRRHQDRSIRDASHFCRQVAALIVDLGYEVAAAFYCDLWSLDWLTGVWGGPLHKPAGHVGRHAGCGLGAANAWHRSSQYLWLHWMHHHVRQLQLPRLVDYAKLCHAQATQAERSRWRYPASPRDEEVIHAAYTAVSEYRLVRWVLSQNRELGVAPATDSTQV